MYLNVCCMLHSWAQKYSFFMDENLNKNNSFDKFS